MSTPAAPFWDLARRRGPVQPPGRRPIATARRACLPNLSTSDLARTHERRLMMKVRVSQSARGESRARLVRERERRAWTGRHGGLGPCVDFDNEISRPASESSGRS